MPPKVSIVIPVYGTEQFVGRTLDCLLDQPFADIEVICVDDCSPDGSGAVLDEYAARDGRVVPIHLPQNHGQGHARNVGMDRAQGEYLYFIDSDDLCDPCTISTCVELCDADELDGVFFDVKAFADDPELMRANGELVLPKGTYPEGVATGAELFDALVTQREWICFPQRQFWRRSFLQGEGVRFPDASSHEDELFSHEAFLLARRMRYVRKPLFFHRWREGSIMTTPPTPKTFYSYFRGYMGMIEFNRSHGIELRSAQINAARIYDRLCLYFKTLDEEELRPWFTERDERLLFEFFVETQQVDLAYFATSLDISVVRAAREAKRLFIYGAGVVGRRVLSCLSVSEVPVDAVMVSNAEGNPPALLGHRVVPLPVADGPREGDLVIIAVSAKFRDEVEAALDENGWPHVHYQDVMV